MVSPLGTVSAWQWPVPTPVVSMSFGQDAGGYLMRGMEFAAGAQPVYPVEGGVVVASGEDESFRDRGAAPSGLGSYVVVEHAQGFRSIYAHVDAEALPAVGQRVTPETQIATVGQTGLVPGRALRLYIVDLENGEYINPVLLLPDLADTLAPAIGTVYARSADALYDLRQTRVLPSGRYEITARIDDRIATTRTAPSVAPYTVRVFVAGQETYGVIMDRVAVRAGETRLEPRGGDADTLYGVEGGFSLGSVSLAAGQVSLEFVAVDFAGNQASWSVNLTAALPEPASAEAASREGGAR